LRRRPRPKLGCGAKEGRKERKKDNNEKFSKECQSTAGVLFLFPTNKAHKLSLLPTLATVCQINVNIFSALSKTTYKQHSVLTEL
jgi:hypothetical protein